MQYKYLSYRLDGKFPHDIPNRVDTRTGLMYFLEQVADTVGFSTDWVRKLAHRYNRLGAKGIATQRRSLRKESLRKDMQSVDQ